MILFVFSFLGDGTPTAGDETRRHGMTSSALRNKKALLHPHFSSVLFALHLLYEELKLNTLRGREQEQLVPILYQLARDLGCDAYVHHYWADAPSQCRLVPVPPMRSDVNPCMKGPPPSIFRHLSDILLKKTDLTPYPYLEGVNERSKNIIEVINQSETRSMAHYTISPFPPHKFNGPLLSPKSTVLLLLSLSKKKISYFKVIFQG